MNCMFLTVIKEDDLLAGWYEHFQELSTAPQDPSFDQDYHRFVSLRAEEIEDICRAEGQPASPVTTEEVKRAIKALNKGKVAYAMESTTEYLVYAEDSVFNSLCSLLNTLFQTGQMIEYMQIRRFIPVYKKQK